MAALTGKVALVTGGTAGIGRAAAVALARAGAKVVVAGRNADAGRETVRQVHEAGGEARFVRADVTKDADVRALVEETLRAYGRLDVAFNNAGVEGAAPSPVAEQTEANYDAIFDANVRGV